MARRLEITGVSRAEAARLRADARVQAALGALPARAPGARLVFADENGPKGGRAFRCAITVGRPARSPVHVESVATTPRLALDGALTKLERRLARERDLARESRRRPKKYYAALRARASAG